MTRCANKKCAMPVDLRGSRACSISGIPYTTARVWSCTRFESAETPAEGCDWKPVITDSDENGEREIELRLSPTKQLLVTVTPDGLREPIVRHDDTGTYEHFVVLPADVVEQAADRVRRELEQETCCGETGYPYSVFDDADMVCHHNCTAAAVYAALRKVEDHE